MRAVVRLPFVVLALCALALAACGGSDSPPEPPKPPSAPTGLAATPFDGAVALTWTAAPGATSYSVYRSDTAGTALAGMSKVGSGIAGEAFNAQAANGTTWYFRVTAVNAGGESPASDEASALPDAALLPAAPAGVTAAAGDRSVTITWDAVPAATSYRVYYTTTPGVTTGATYQACTSPCTISSLLNGTAYYFAVSAFISADQSALSTEVMATPRVLPYIHATAVMAPSGSMYGPGQYSVEVCTTSGCSTPITNATVTLGGISLSYDAGNKEYAGVPTSSIAGQNLELVVTIPSGTAVASGTYRASGTMYTQSPRIASPTSSSTWQASSSNTFTWTHGAPTASSVYVVTAINMGTIFTGLVYAQVPVTENSYTVGAGSLVAGSYIAAVALNPASGPLAIPNAQTGSTFAISASSDPVYFTVQ